MFNNVTPESAGISSALVLKFLKILEKHKFNTHSIIMARGNDIFAECYYAPFTKDFKHRMYSVSKSFVSVAVGLAIEDGLLSIEDKFVDYFKEYENENFDEKLKSATIRDLLRMESSMEYGVDWFTSGTDDRNEVYFRKLSDKHPGTMFSYDSSASYMLGVIVEKLTRKPFLEYLKEKVLDKIGFSKDSYCIKCPGGYSFGDSGVMCTSRDLLLFAKFVLNKGEWNGERLMNKEYLEAATARQADNDYLDSESYGAHGYGYQIWKAPRDGFAFVGMGDQFAICDPEKDFIFVINSDNQGRSPETRTLLYYELYNTIVTNLGESLEENPEALAELKSYISNLKLRSLKDEGGNTFQKEIDGVCYKLEENPMNIEYVRFDFEGKKGILSYKNKQGGKKLYFGVGYNEFAKFPEEGYSDMTATKWEKGHYYDCACSATWAEKQKLKIKVQIIDKYFGIGSMVFSFKDDLVTVKMKKVAENFLNEYEGMANGKASGK